MSYKLVIFGSRTVKPSAATIKADILREFGELPDEIVSGGAGGTDQAAIEAGRIMNIPITVMNADWNQFGKIAGYRRNADMADYADVGLGYWRDNSGGTANMTAQMVSKGKPVRLLLV